jgi:hypothetical protein
MENIPVTISTPRWCHALTVQHLGLVEGEDVNVVTLVLLDDVCRVLVGVEGVHQDEGDVDVVGAVEELDLTDGQVEVRRRRRRMERGERRRRRSKSANTGADAEKRGRRRRTSKRGESCTQTRSLSWTSRAQEGFCFSV